jgi:chromosome segregation ATPase
MSVQNLPPNLHLPSTGNTLADIVLVALFGGVGAKLWHHYQTRVNAKDSRESILLAARAAREKMEFEAEAAREQIELAAATQRDKLLADYIQWTKDQYVTLLARISAAEDRARSSDERSRALQMENGDCHRKHEELSAQCVNLRAQNERQAKEIADLTMRLAALERK